MQAQNKVNAISVAILYHVFNQNLLEWIMVYILLLYYSRIVELFAESVYQIYKLL